MYCILCRLKVAQNLAGKNGSCLYRLIYLSPQLHPEGLEGTGGVHFIFSFLGLLDILLLECLEYCIFSIKECQYLEYASEMSSMHRSLKVKKHDVCSETRKYFNGFFYVGSQETCLWYFRIFFPLSLKITFVIIRCLCLRFMISKLRDFYSTGKWW